MPVTSGRQAVKRVKKTKDGPSTASKVRSGEPATGRAREAQASPGRTGKTRLSSKRANSHSDKRALKTRGRKGSSVRVGSDDVPLGRLPSDRRPALERTLRQIALLLSDPVETETVSRAAFEREAQVVVDTLRVLRLGGSRQLQSLITALEPVRPTDPDSVDQREATLRGNLRLQTLYRKIVTDSFTVAEIGERWGVSRQRLKQLRDKDQLFAISVPYHRGMLYPRWQFEDDFRPRPIMPNLIHEARDAGLDAIDFHQLMSNPASGDGTAPVEMLNRGQQAVVLGIIKASDG